MAEVLGKSFRPTYVAEQQTTSGGVTGGYYKPQAHTAVSYDMGGTRPTDYLSGNVGAPADSVVGVRYTGPQPSSTVMSNANIIDSTIPKLKSDFQRMVSPPSYQLQDDNSFGRYAPSSPDPRIAAIEAQIRQTNDQSFQQQLQSISSNFGSLRAAQERINKSSEEGREQALLMSGSSRYSPLSSEGVMQAEKSYGIEKLAAITAREEAAKADARYAFDQSNFRQLEREMGRLEKIQEERNAISRKIQEEQAADMLAASEREREVGLGLAVGEMISQGITDPYQILSTLTEAGGDFTPEEISNTAKFFTVKGNNPGDIKSDFDLFSYFQANDKLPQGISSLPENEQYFAWLNAQKLANSGKLGAASSIYGGSGAGFTPGVGAKNAVEEQLIRDQLFVAFTPLFNKGTLSESDRPVIEEKVAFYRNAGLSSGEILSAFAGFPLDLETPYNEKLSEKIIATTPTADSQREMMMKVSVLLKNGSYGDAVRTVENQAINRAKEQGVINSDQFATEDDVKYVKEKVGEIEKLLGKGVFNEVGAFTGTMNQFLSQKFGFLKAAQMRAKLSSLTASMINKRAGSAITETEWERLIEPSIPSMNEAASTWRAKLGELENNVLQRHNSGRSVAALPEIKINQLTPESRLPLYASSPEQDDFWGNNGGASVITDGTGIYEIPEE